MRETFGWKLSAAEQSVDPRLHVVQFGDGYEQVAPDGLNAIGRTWSVNRAGCTALEADAIDAFLSARSGCDWFWWTPPFKSVPIKVRCAKWALSPQNRLTTVTATFKQVFDPGL